MTFARSVFVERGRNPGLRFVRRSPATPHRVHLRDLDTYEKFEKAHIKLGCELWWTQAHEDQITDAWLQLIKENPT